MSVTVGRIYHIINTLCFALHLHPYYDFGKKKTLTNIKHKTAAFLKIIIVLSVCIISLKGRISIFSENSSVITICLDVVLFVIETSITTLIIGMSSFGDMKKWDTVLNFVKWKVIDSGDKWKCIISCGCMQILALILIGIRSWLLTNVLGFNVYRYYIVRDIVSYHAQLQCVVFVYMVYHVRGGFRKLNQSLQDLDFGKNVETDVEVMDNKVKPANLKFSPAYDVAKLRQLYMQMQEIVEAINKIFGLKILFLTGYVTASVLNLLYASVALFNRNRSVNNGEVVGPLVINGILSCGIMVNIYLLHCRARQVIKYL